MSNTTQKRKPYSADPSEPSSIKKQKSNPTLSPDAQLLARVVDKTQSSILQTTLLSYISTCSPSELDALKRILEPLVTATLNPLHCVRCHQSYIEQENDWASCSIPHEESDYLDYDYEDMHGDPLEHPRGPMMRYPCCGEQFREYDENPQDSCVWTKHTTNPKDVKYYMGSVELPPKQRNEPIGFGRTAKTYEGLNINVITCQEAGCTSEH